MPRLYSSILDCIGNTPVVRVNKIGPAHVELYVKLEAANPMSSVKDRLALGIIEAAEADGSLQPGQTVIEATSGNTGIGLAMVCAQKGYPLVITMAESFSVERRRLMRFLGARVVLTPAAERATGMVRVCEALAARHGWFMTQQFANEANPAYHRNTTGPEVLRDFANRRLDYFVSGYGTGGTISGAGQMIRLARPEVKIISTEPAGASLLEGKPWQPHKIQGWTPDFIPKLTGDAVAMELIDRIVPIQNADAIQASKDLAAKEGIFCGITSGGTFAGAIKIAAEAPKGANILAMLPDTAERYLSTPLFADIGADMNEEELAISRSTPSGQLKT